MKTAEHVSRRSFLKVMGGVGASLVIGCFPKSAAGSDKANALAPTAFVRIDPEGMVTVTVSKSDMGQGVRTTFAMLVAEELDADWSKVRAENAQANPSLYGGQGTGGSSSTRSMHKRLRESGAAARMMLVAAAAKQWGVDPSDCTTENGRVLHQGKSLGYGELAAEAAKMPVPNGNLRLKEKSEYRIIGKPKVRVDNRDVVTGKAIYGQDVKVDGAHYAVVARKPTYGASVRSFDAAEAKKVPGVVDVVQIRSGVAVVGKDTWAALNGLEALEVDWDLGPNTGVSTGTLQDALHKAVGDHKEMPAGAKVVEAGYDYPYLAHATMEPMNAVADVREDRATIWVPSQAPDNAQQSVARLLGLAPEKVTVHLTLIGGGFGRRFDAQFAEEAAEISKAVKKPVKLQWTREDDTKNDNYRPMSYHHLRGAIDSQGKAIGWSHQALFAPGGRGRSAYGDPENNYDIPGAGLMRGGVASPISTGAWRSVQHTQIDVSNEMFIDELAHAAGKDPYEFRKAHMKDERLRRVLDIVAERSGWGAPLPKGRGRGMACFNGYGSRSAHVIEVSVEGDEIKVHRVVCAADPGICINPRGVEAQMEGGCVDGLSTALKAEITIDGGAVEQSSFADYEWFRMEDMPKIEVTVIDGGTEFGGMGEVGYPGVPAAVANAVFAAIGKRVRKFPIRVSELV